MNERLRNLLCRSFDEELSEQEQRELEQALSFSSQLRQEQKQLTDMRQLIKKESVRSFQPFFAARVMHRIKNEMRESEDFIGSLVWAFRWIAVSGAVAILLLVGSHVFLEKNYSLAAVLGMPQPALEDTLELENPLLEETQ